VLPDNPVRRFFYLLNKDVRFDVLGNIVAVLNVFVVAFNYDDNPAQYSSVVLYINYGFSFFVVLELVVKLLAFRIC
jgi:hypothetical protein